MRSMSNNTLRKLLAAVGSVACVLALSTGLVASAEGEAVTEFVTDKLNLADGGTNLIAGADFESTPADGSGWNVADFTGAAQVITEGAYEGQNKLTFTAGAEGATAKFTVPVTANTEYVFSAWVKGPLLSADNTGSVQFGVANANGEFLVAEGVVNSAVDKALTPPAWDGAWHQRGYVFNSGDLTSVTVQITGTATTADFDNLLLCVADEAEAVEIADPDAPEYDAPDVAKMNCKAEDNLFEDYNFSADDHSFWTDEAVSDIFTITKDGSNPVLKTSGKNSGLTYIKWIEVEPNTEYTFTADLKGLLLEEGEGTSAFGLMIHNGVQPKSFGDIDVPFYDEWNITSFTFNSGEYDRIGFYVYDGLGELMLDNLRLFEASKGIALGEGDTNVGSDPDPIIPDQDDPGSDGDGSGDGSGDGEGDISPITGVVFPIIYVVLALASAGTVVVLWKTKKTRQNEA